MIKRLLLAGLFVLCSLQANAALVVTGLGKVEGIPNGSHQLTATTGGDCPVGSLIVIFNSRINVTVNDLASVADSASNTYGSPFDGQTNALGFIAVIWVNAINTGHDLPNGGTITLTYGNPSVQPETALIACVTGANTSSPLDISGKTANNGVTPNTTCTTPGCPTTGTLAQAAEVIFGGGATAAGSGTYTCNGSFSKIETQTGTAGATMCTLIVASTASVGFSPSWATTNPWLIDMTSFKAVSAIKGVPSSLSLMGIGQ